MKTKLQITQLQNDLIYSKAAFARVFGVLPKRIRRVMVWWIGFWVWVEGKRPRLYKKSIFQEHFALFRKNAAKNLTVNQTNSTQFQVNNEEKSTNHVVSYKVNSVTGKPRYECDCEDFKNLNEAFKTPACKHIYSVLNSQGFASIAQSISAHVAEQSARAVLGF